MGNRQLFAQTPFAHKQSINRNLKIEDESNDKTEDARHGEDEMKQPPNKQQKLNLNRCLETQETRRRSKKQNKILQRVLKAQNSNCYSGDLETPNPTLRLPNTAASKGLVRILTSWKELKICFS